MKKIFFDTLFFSGHPIGGGIVIIVSNLNLSWVKLMLGFDNKIVGLVPDKATISPMFALNIKQVKKLESFSLFFFPYIGGAFLRDFLMIFLQRTCSALNIR